MVDYLEDELFEMIKWVPFVRGSENDVVEHHLTTLTFDKANMSADLGFDETGNTLIVKVTYPNNSIEVFCLKLRTVALLLVSSIARIEEKKSEGYTAQDMLRMVSDNV